MKADKKLKRLRLVRETLRQLSGDQLLLAVGGTLPTLVPTAVAVQDLEKRRGA
jgi:hypothetical protein